MNTRHQSNQPSQVVSVSPHSLCRSEIMLLVERYRNLYFETIYILEIAGVSPFDTHMMVNPYTKERDNENFSNVWRHCVAVANFAEQLAQKCREWWLINESEKVEIIKAALLHDGDKRLELMRKKARSEWLDVDPYGEAGYATIEKIFSDASVDPKTLKTIKTMWWLTGHNSLKQFIILGTDGNLTLNLERSLADMIIHIADDSTYSSPWSEEEVTSYVPFLERARRSEFEKKYAFLWKEWLEFWTDGITHIKQDENIENTNTRKSYYDLQALVYTMICAHLQKAIDPNSTKKPEEFIVWVIIKNTVANQSDSTRLGVQEVL